ncbi:MAG: type II CAAX endopeptidase family protein [Planctomycetota bacterium]
MTDPERHGQPRILAALLVLFSALPFSLLLGILLSFVAFGVATDFEGDLDAMAEVETWMEDLSPLEFLLLFILPAQALVAAMAVLPAALAREPFARRLGFVRPRIAWRWLPVFCLGSLFAAGLGELLAGAVFDEPSAHIERISALIVEPEGLVGLLMIFSLSVVPGFCEELLYRGYVQHRLQKRWTAPLAIGLPGLIFALAHMDPMHVLGVLPLGLWFGFVGWGTRSVVPPMVCHAVSNAIAVLVARTLADADEEVLAAVGAPLTAMALPAFVVSCVVLVRGRLTRP